MLCRIHLANRLFPPSFRITSYNVCYTKLLRSAVDQDKNRIYAIKFNEILETDEAEADDIRAEHQLEKLVRLHHIHILPFHEYGFKEGLRFTVSPYIPGGTLAQKVKSSSVSLKNVLRYAMEIRNNFV